MTKYLKDIFNQPSELSHSLEHTFTDGYKNLFAAANIIRQSKTIFISAIGASWNAGLAIQACFNQVGIIAILCDASDFLYFTKISPQSTVIFLSRSGKSVEIVNAISKCKLAKALIISITNACDSLLADISDCCLLTHVKYDHGISVSTYTSILLTGQLLALAVNKSNINNKLFHSLNNFFKTTEKKIIEWNEALHNTDWIDPDKAYYFIARGMNLSSAFESMLLWEEAAKQPASALTTGAFRHGPQEMVNENINIGIWLDSGVRGYDIELVNDLYNVGVNVLTIGVGLPKEMKGYKIDVAPMQEHFYPVINIIPMQLASEKLANDRGENPDTFRFCKLVVEEEGGL